MVVMDGCTDKARVSLGSIVPLWVFLPLQKGHITVRFDHSLKIISQVYFRVSKYFKQEKHGWYTENRWFGGHFIPSLDGLDLGFRGARLPLSSSAASQPSMWWSNPGWKRRDEACKSTLLEAGHATMTPVAIISCTVQNREHVLNTAGAKTAGRTTRQGDWSDILHGTMVSYIWAYGSGTRHLLAGMHIPRNTRKPFGPCFIGPWPGWKVAFLSFPIEEFWLRSQRAKLSRSQAVSLEAHYLI